jgi:murein L,D-transpeptidase YcbB/YkuD
MLGFRLDRILTGTAIALVLAVTGADAAGPAPGQAEPVNAATVEPAAPTAAPAAATTEPAAPAAPPGAAEPAAPAATPAAAEPNVPAALNAATTPDEASPSVPAKAETAPAEPQTQKTETSPPDPFASLDPADRPIAEKIRDLLAAKVDKIFATKKERAAVETFYQNRNLAPLWIEKGVEGKRAKSAIARLQAADTDGLDSVDYKIPDFTASSPEALAEADLKLTETVLTYARHVQAGRFSYASVSKNIELPQQPPEPSDVLTKVADAPDAGKALGEFSPPQPGYQALKKKLAELRNRKGAGGNEIANGPELRLAKVPMEDPRVPRLRERLELKGGDPGDQHYDGKLAEAVKRFQRANDLRVTGNLDAQTIRELNGPPRDRQIDTIIVNMERWRWYPRDMGKTRVVVNLTDFTLRLYRDDKQIWMTRIVDGKPATPTPLLTETMKYITVNPTWNVPQSIVQNEYLPALEQDPTVLDRMGLKVTRERDGGIHVYQPPGDNNALGRLRFNFPNRFDVYQHDTPDKYLFKEDRRAYSHGCMRVQDPVKYAELLLSIERPSEGYTEDRIKRLFGPNEQDIQFPAPIPVHLTYQTAFVDDDGQLAIRSDLYGLDSRLLSLIKTERSMIDVASKERDHDAAVAATAGARRSIQAQLPPQQPSSFFQALFGGPSVPNGPVGRPPANIRSRPQPYSYRW